MLFKFGRPLFAPDILARDEKNKSLALFLAIDCSSFIEESGKFVVVLL